MTEPTVLYDATMWGHQHSIPYSMARIQAVGEALDRQTRRGWARIHEEAYRRGAGMVAWDEAGERPPRYVEYAHSRRQISVREVVNGGRGMMEDIMNLLDLEIRRQAERNYGPGHVLGDPRFTTSYSHQNQVWTIELERPIRITRASGGTHGTWPR